MLSNSIALLIETIFRVVKWGWWQSLLFILIMLGVSHLLRVTLKGEWSDTSWLNILKINKNEEE